MLQYVNHLYGLPNVLNGVCVCVLPVVAIIIIIQLRKQAGDTFIELKPFTEWKLTWMVDRNPKPNVHLLVLETHF